MDTKCINCDSYDWSLGQCNVEGDKPCEAVPVEKSFKKKKIEDPIV